MIRDITLLARLARLADVTSTLRAVLLPFFMFAGLQALVTGWGFQPPQPQPAFEQSAEVGEIRAQDEEITYYQEEIDHHSSYNFWTWWLPAVSALLMVFVSDLLARLPLRIISGGLAFLFGLFWHALFTCVLLMIALLVLAFCIAAGLGEPLIPEESFRDLGEVSAADWSLIGIFGALIALSIYIWHWFFTRRVEMELGFASQVPRSLIIGGFAAWTPAVWLCFLIGIPSALWRWESLRKPSPYLFIAARALLYLAYLSVFAAVAVYIRFAAENDLFRIFAAQSQESAAIYLASALDTTYLAQLLLWPLDLISSPADSFRLLAMFALMVSILIVSHWLFAYAKRLATDPPWLTQDRSAEGRILFLRSFGDDQVRLRRPWHDFIGNLLDLWAYRRNVDELLADEAAQYGELIALGSPGEEPQKLGARRGYASMQDWQSVIQDTARSARAVVICVADTEGIEWELAMLRAEGLMSKTLVLIPPGLSHSRAADALRSNGEGLNLDYDPSLRPIGYNGARAELFVSDKALSEHYLVAQRAFFQSLPRGAA